MIAPLLVPHTSTAGHTRGHSAPGNNGGGPPGRLKPAPQRGKDTNNPSPLTQSHKQPPGAAAQPAEPGPNPARRGAEPTVYIAHPTHGAGTRPNRTQPPTAARKTTLNAGQCVRQPGKAEGGTGSPPPQKKTNNKGGRGGGARKQPSATKPPANTTRGGQTPPPEGTEDRTPEEARGDHPAETGNTKPGTAAHREKGHRSMQTHTTKKKKEPAVQPERKGMGGRGPQGPGHGHPAKKKKKRKKHTPTTQPRRPGQSRDPGPTRTPTPHAGTGSGGGQAGRARNHRRPISRPKPNPNHEHHKQPTLEGQHHKPCPNTPTQDPSQDWRG